MDGNIIGFALLLALFSIQQSTPQGYVKLNGALHYIRGSDAMLNCKVESDEMITQVTWQREHGAKKENFLIRNKEGTRAVTSFGERVKFVTNVTSNGTIVIPNVQLSDEANYICIFTLYPSGPVEQKIRLEIVVPPNVKSEVNPGVIGSCNRTTIAKCTAASGKPAATISWSVPSHDNIFINSTTSDHSNGTKTVTSWLEAITVQSLNQKEVSCTVRHDGLNPPSIYSMKLIVQYPPSSAIVRFSSDSHGEADLICEADSNPPATNFRWSKKNGTLPSSVQNEQKLHLSKLDASMSGLYICEIANVHGSATGFFYLHLSSNTDRHRIYSILGAVLIVALAVVAVSIWNLLQNKDTSNSGGSYTQASEGGAPSPSPQSLQSSQAEQPRRKFNVISISRKGERKAG
ncbi:nectin-1-like isoform X2 [Protopterus annectens]|uniref:nectin-1-like isoform X2 n=1 Tax=Protopterus annectens TaxID=7888 RepID=UPI001CF948AD|nr:nectin-1-like isoform X2 [Protopterus annectens]